MDANHHQRRDRRQPPTDDHRQPAGGPRQAGEDHRRPGGGRALHQRQPGGGQRQPADDRALHRRLLAGDRGAEAALYRRHLQRVQRACRAVLVDEHLAQDAAHEVFLEYFARPERARLEQAPLAAYLVMVARRRSIDLVRSRERSRHREQAAMDLLVDAGRPSDTAIESVPARLDLVRAMAGLPDEQRAVLARTFYDRQTYRDAAGALGIAEGTAKSRIRSALSRLRDEPALAQAA